MSPRSTDIRRVPAKDLFDFACAAIDQLSDDDVVPITKQRALAQSKNPYADDDDVGLFVAYSRERIVGYLGLLPGMLRARNGLHKVYYGTTAYVAPEYRGKLVGLALMQDMLSLPYDYVVTGFNEDGRTLCEAFRLPKLGPLEYYTFDLKKLRKWNPADLPVRLAKRLTSAKRRSLTILQPGIQRADDCSRRVFKRLFYRMALRSQAKLLREVVWEEVHEFGDGEAELIARRNTDAEFYRGVECLNWMLRDRWIVETREPESKRPQYQFSDVRDLFKYVPIRVYRADDREYLGFLALSISTAAGRTWLKVLDFGCGETSGHQHLASIAVKCARECLADEITMPGQLADCLGNGFPMKLVASRLTRDYYCRPNGAQGPLATALPDLALNYCDGDGAFT